MQPMIPYLNTGLSYQLNGTGGVNYFDRGGAPITNTVFAQNVGNDNMNTLEADVARGWNPTGDVLGASTTTGSGTSTGYSPGDLAYIDDQIAKLNAQKQNIDRTYNNGLAQIDYNYNQGVSGTNTARGRAIEDFGTQRDSTIRGKDRAIDTVDTNARTLRDSLQRRLGMASGSDSSAYQLTAPNAIARDASKNRTGVVEDYGANFMALDTAEKRAKDEYDLQLKQYDDQKRTARSDYEANIMGKRDEVDTSLYDAVAKRTQLLGGGYDQIKADTAPLTSDINSREAAIAGLFDKYKNPYSIKPVTVDTPTLRDYLVDRTAINANQTQGQSTYSPYAQFLKKQTEEQL